MKNAEKSKLMERANNTVFVGGGKRRHLHSKKHILILGSGMAIVLLLVTAMFTQLHSKNTAPGSKTPSSQQLADQAVSRTVINPDYNTANKTLQQQLANAKTDKARADIYINMASIAAQQGDTQKIIDYLSEVIKLDPSRTGLVSLNLADAYKATGDRQRALTYYQKALSYYEQTSSRSGKDYFIAQINDDIKAVQQ